MTGLRLKTCVLLCFTCLSVHSTSSADILHLASGRAIPTNHWWVDGDTLHYENDAGTVGIPRSAVVRIERTGRIEQQRIRGTLSENDHPVNDKNAIKELSKATEELEKGKNALYSRAYEDASSIFMSVLRDNPRLSVARVGYALSEIAMNRDSLALSIVLEGLALDPDNSELHELLGDIRNREERVDDAVRSWKKAFELSPGDRLREKIVKGERELHAGRYYSFSTSPHFNVRYGDDLDPALAAGVTDSLEEQYWEISDRLRHAPQQPITVLLYPERQFRDVTLAPESVAGLFDGKIRVPLGGITRIDARATALLKHELTHAVVHSKTRGNCPRWLHEGLAQMFEGRSLTRASLDEVRQILSKVPADSWQSQGFSYAAALSFTKFLESRKGFDSLVALLDRLSMGDDTEAAMKYVYSESYSRLCRLWDEELTDKD